MVANSLYTPASSKTEMVAKLSSETDHFQYTLVFIISNFRIQNRYAGVTTALSQKTQNLRRLGKAS